MKNSKNKKRVLVIVHDAGGAEIISAYIQKYKNQVNFKSFVTGPAEAIFRREKILFSHIENNRFSIASTIKKHIDSKYLMVGTMWHTRIELIALQEARRAGLHTVAYLDSWVNYRERFDYPRKKWQKNLPDELWVGDEEAQNLAKKLFPKSISIKLVPNQYFISIQKRYKILQTKTKHNLILFLSNSSDKNQVAFLWLIKVVSNMENKPIIKIRFHPSDKRKWFNVFSTKYGSQIKISDEQELVQDLTEACVVVGLETTALVVALLCGLPSICIKTKGTKATLPFKKINTVTNTVELKKQLQKIFIC